MPLTYLQCENAKPQSTPFKLSDGKGLYLQVMPNGSRYWQYRYQLLGKQRCLSIGKYPDVGLADARISLKNYREKVTKKIDPLFEKQQERKLFKYQSAHDLKSLATEWVDHNRPSWTSKHGDYVFRRLELHAFPDLGCYPADEVPTAIISACLQQVEKNAPEMARRVLNMLSRIFKYGCATGRCTKDPTFGLESVLRKYKPGHYAAVTLDELPTLVRKIHSNDARFYRQTNLCLKLMLLTAVRTSELIEAKWSEFNLEEKIWIIPAERMKTRRLHKVPLSNQAYAILKELKELNGKRDFVFPSISRPRKAMSNATLLKALATLGYKYKMTGHGFRSILMGVCKQHLGYRHEPVDRQLAHVPRNSVDRAYDRADYLPERVIMMQEYADYIDSILKNQLLERRPPNEYNRKQQPLGFTTYASYNSGYSTGISYRTTGFTQAVDGGQIPETAQGRREQTKLLVEGRNSQPLQ